MFPISPSLDERFTANGTVFVWDGTKWTSPTPITVYPPTIGATGPVGEQGDPGDPTSPGVIGVEGLQGATGPQGDQSTVEGEKGATGPTGDTGEDGPVGDPAALSQGSTGATGATGASVATMDDLTDVDAPAPFGEQVLQWNDDISKFESEFLIAPFISGSDLNVGEVTVSGISTYSNITSDEISISDTINVTNFTAADIDIQKGGFVFVAPGGGKYLKTPDGSGGFTTTGPL